MLALQVPHTAAQGSEDIFECNGDDEEQRIFNEEKIVDRMQNFKESVRAKTDSQSETFGLISSRTLSPSEAFEVFQGKVFSSRTEYIVPDSVEKRVETPIQKFSRLRMELEELRSDLDSMTAESEKPADSTIWGTLQAEAKKLVLLSDSLEKHQGFKVFNANATNMNYRLDQVIKAEISPLEDASNSDNLSRTKENSKVEPYDVSILERRVFALETFLGSSSNTLNMEAAGAQHGGLGSQEESGTFSISGRYPLIDSISRLEKQLSLLDAASLDILRVKATALRSELEAASKFKSSQVESQVVEAVKKVDDLHEKINRVQAVAADLPSLIIRLKTLEDVHTQSASFSLKLKNLETLAQNASEDLKSNSDVLSNLKEGFAANLVALRGSIQNVDDRITKLNSA